MNKSSWTIGLACSVVIVLANSRAEARQIPFNGSLSATSVSNEMDIDGDGVKNSLIVGGAKSTQGSSTVQGPGGEFVVSEAVPCPEGSVGLTETPGTAGLIFRFERTGDLLIEKDTSFTECVDPSTGLFFGSGTGVIMGGTGRFAGATGSFEYTHCTGETLFFEQPPGDQGFFSFTCEFTGTINTTK
jgi:hypothetical protein